MPLICRASRCSQQPFWSDGLGTTVGSWSYVSATLPRKDGEGLLQNTLNFPKGSGWDRLGMPHSFVPVHSMGVFHTWNLLCSVGDQSAHQTLNSSIIGPHNFQVFPPIPVVRCGQETLPRWVRAVTQLLITVWANQTLGLAKLLV